MKTSSSGGGDVEVLAVHLVVRDDDRLRHAGGDRMRGIDGPDHLALAAGVRPPAQRAGGAHEALEDLRVVRGVEDDQAHARPARARARARRPRPRPGRARRGPTRSGRRSRPARLPSGRARAPRGSRRGR